MNKLAFAFIIILAIFTRFYQLGSVPAGLTNDEADIGYDAYSIYKTGRDQWGQSFPLISFKGFGDYRPPLYTYLVVPLIPVFDLTPIAVRFPSATFSIISIILLYFVLKKLFSTKEGLVGSLLFAISPWSIGLSRIGIESTVAAALLLGGIFSFIKSTKNILYLYLSIFFFSLTLYTYSGYLLLTPTVLVLLVFFYRSQLIKNLKNVFISIGIFVLLCFPLFIQNDSSAKIRFSQVNFLQDITSTGIINQVNDKRGECLKVYSPVICKLTVNKVIAFGSTLIKNYISHFSVSYLYINGNETQYSILPKRGLFYIFDFFLFISGLIFIVKKNKKEGYLLLVLLLVSIVPDTITGGGHFSRSFAMLPFKLSIEALGIIAIFNFIKNKKRYYLALSLISLIAVVIFFSSTVFFLEYLSYFKVFYSRFSDYGYYDLMKFINTEKNKYSRIYISSHMNDSKQYIYYLFYNRYDPVKYQEKRNIKFVQNDDGWIRINQIDNIYFVDALPIGELVNYPDKNKILLFSSPVDFPGDTKIIKSVYDLKKDTLFTAATFKEYLHAREKLE